MLNWHVRIMIKAVELLLIKFILFLPLTEHDTFSREADVPDFICFVRLRDSVRLTHIVDPV